MVAWSTSLKSGPRASILGWISQDFLGCFCIGFLLSSDLVSISRIFTLRRFISLRSISLAFAFARFPRSFLWIYFEAEGRVAALRAASRKSFGLSVQDINGRRPFISFRANGPKDHLRYRNMVRRTILLLRAYKGSIHGPFICDTMLFILE